MYPSSDCLAIDPSQHSGEATTAINSALLFVSCADRLGYSVRCDTASRARSGSSWLHIVSSLLFLLVWSGITHLPVESCAQLLKSMKAALVKQTSDAIKTYHSDAATASKQQQLKRGAKTHADHEPHGEDVDVLVTIILNVLQQRQHCACILGPVSNWQLACCGPLLWD